MNSMPSAPPPALPLPSGATSKPPATAAVAPAPAGTPAARFELPDLCSPVAVFGVVLACQLLALLLTLARQPSWLAFYTNLAQVGLLLLWIGLLSAAGLCRLRPWLTRFSVLDGSVLTFGVVMAVILGVSEATYWLGRLLGAGPDTGGNWFPTNHAGFVTRNLAIGGLVMGPVLRYFFIYTEWQRNVRREAESRLVALQARIRPHFLFNSMNTIAALTRESPAAAEQAVLDLADLFRASLAEASQLIPVAEEFEIARVYERIERLRLGERLEVDWDVAAIPASLRVPGLTLQPLLENAIYHGIEPSPLPGRIGVRGRITGGRVEIVVDNPLPPAGEALRRPGNRLALDNIRERLALAFGDRAGLTTATADGRFTATLHFPAGPAP
jgi:two-component system sensor histidine kinase AlgZ